MRIFLLSLILAASWAGPVFAEDKPVKDTPPAATAKTVETDNPHIKTMKDKAQALAQTLTPEEAQYFAGVRDNFGVLRSINVARDSVGDAVKLCADKNPDLKDDITKRHKDWDDSIGAAVKKQEKVLDTAVTKEHFKNPKQVQDYLDTIDKAAHYADEKIEKKIITTPEACKNLMNSMDSTKKTILDLVTTMTWPEEAPAGTFEDKASAKKTSADKTAAPEKAGDAKP